VNFASGLCRQFTFSRLPLQDRVWFKIGNMPNDSLSPSTVSNAAIALQLQQFAPRDPQYATRFVEHLLSAACNRGASDIHLTPSPQGLQVAWRIDGVLQHLGVFAPGETADVVARLKVLADLLTYRQELPQEGRLRTSDAGVEMRISTFPTLFGERLVVRIFREAQPLDTLASLGLPNELKESLHHSLQQTSGAIIVTGPAGSGKTTTVYAALRELLRSEHARSIMTLEDPVECVLPGVSQSAIQPSAGFDFAVALRSLMRQDPEVILVGEMRDRETTVAAFQAALTGHLVLTTFHAGSTCGAISRLTDMGIEPYVLRSGLQSLIAQRLVRRLCACSATTHQATLSQDCAACSGTGYCGRMVLAELLPPLVGELGALVLAKADAQRLAVAACSAGLRTLAQRAQAALAAGQTSLAEIHRVLGLGYFPATGDTVE
jgi:type II secretory ATPase GspE/PulE/Tfp pilus assembly ATPase PilB-like protein